MVAKQATPDVQLAGSGSANTAAHSDHTHAGSSVVVEKGDVAVVTPALAVIDFDANAFTVAEAPAGEANVGMNFGSAANTPAAGNHNHDVSYSTLAHKSRHVAAGADAFVAGDLLDATAKVAVRKNTGANVGSRRRLNLIEGTNTTLTVADDAGNEEVAVTVASPAFAGTGAAATVARSDHDHNASYSTLAHKSRHVSGGGDAFAGGDLLDATSRVAVRKNTGGADVGARRRINFIEGSNVTLTIADDAASEEIDLTIAAAGASGAPSTASYITQVAEAGLSAEQSLAALATGILKNTTTTGVLSIAIAGTDYATAGHTHTITVAVAFNMDNGASVLATGIKGDIRIPFAATLTKWSLLPDVSGSIQIDLWKDTYANYPPTVADTITASAKPLISSATKNESSTLTGWTTSVSAGDIIRVNIDSVTSIKRCLLVLEMTRTV